MVLPASQEEEDLLELKRRAALADDQARQIRSYQKCLADANEFAKQRGMLADELAAALQKIEWVFSSDGLAGEIVCPWCGAVKKDGHEANCTRQAVLTRYEAAKK